MWTKKYRIYRKEEKTIQLAHGDAVHGYILSLGTVNTINLYSGVQVCPIFFLKLKVEIYLLVVYNLSSPKP